MGLKKCFILLLFAVTGLLLVYWHFSYDEGSRHSELVGDEIVNDNYLSDDVMIGSQPSRPEIVPRNADEMTNVVFLKTHKTGGSSIQNMLMRFSISRQLMFAVPVNGNYFGHPKKFQSSMVRRLKPGYHYNIYAIHSRFSRDGFSNMMPNDTRYITLLRNPVEVFESAYAYYYLDDMLRMPLSRFATTDENASLKTRNKRAHNGKIGRNQMSFDLGMEVDIFEEPELVEEFARKLDSEFDLVMITERLPESLVLLKHLLRWTTDDVVIFHHNSRQEKYKKKISPELEEGIVHWNKADTFLYDYFVDVLERKIAQFGVERMETEVKELQEATNRWYEFCVEGSAKRKELMGKKTEVYSEIVLGFKSKNSDNKTCENLTKAELPFLDEIRKFMRKYYY